ncbi:hypothetical protein DsansV1_C04g0036861 [Dioscorea sansibarensis]
MFVYLCRFFIAYQGFHICLLSSMIILLDFSCPPQYVATNLACYFYPNSLAFMLIIIVCDVCYLFPYHDFHACPMRS